jgi:Zn-dependent metalloprotease
MKYSISLPYLVYCACHLDSYGVLQKINETKIKMGMLKRLLIAACCFFNIHLAMAQPSLYKMKEKIDALGGGTPALNRMTIVAPTQAGVLLSGNEVSRNNVAQWLTTQLEMREGVDAFTPEGTVTNTNGGFEVDNLHQYFKGTKVEHGVVHTTSRESQVVMMQLEFYSIPVDLQTTPVISENTARQNAVISQGLSSIFYQKAGSGPGEAMPAGELVIVRTYADDSTVCLAWKFHIYADRPIISTYVYVDATTGKVVLDDPLIKHSNSNGTADTRYSGRQPIVTDNGGLTPGKPYKLKQFRNGYYIRTENYLRNSWNYVGSDQQSVEFSDNDNNWTDAEYNNGEFDNVALDAHFNAQIVSDYWKQTHLRNGWDNNNGDLLIYVHVNEDGAPMDNAFWNGSNLHMGDGSADTTNGNPPSTSLDDIGHELGHGITTSTCNLVYRWESGALNEGYSDIWAACITNFAKLNYPSLAGELTWRLFEKTTNPNGTSPGPGGRDMKDPTIFSHPKVFQGTFYRPATYQTCPVTTTSAHNDHCGVHVNSGVFNRWFYLITEGDTGIDPLNNPYTIAGLGFGISQKIMYLATMNLTPNATFATASTVTANTTATLYGTGSTELAVVKAAWKAVGVDTNMFDMTTVPIFTTNNFTGIAVGKDGYVWAGTNYSGLYTWNGATWSARSEIPNVRINDIKADKAGGIWVAQSGTQGGATSATAGGVNYFPSPVATSIFYTVSTQTNVPSRNARCIFVDTSRTNDGANPKVWVATMSYLLNGNSTSGMLGQGLYSTSRYFRAVSEGLNIASTTAGTLTVGGTKNEIWTFAQANNGINQLLVYNAGTNALITTYDHNSVPALPSGFVARAIFFDAKKRGWIGLASGGVIVYDENKQWHQINFSSIFPSGASVTFNSITGDKYGDVYIGTSAGLVFFDHGIGEIQRIDSAQSYKLYTRANGLPSNVVNAIAYDTLRFRVWVACDQGIVRWEPLCLGNSCDLKRNQKNAESTTTGPGNWSNPNIWSSGLLPDSSTIVTIADTITVDINADCQAVVVIPPGKVQVAAGIKLNIRKPETEVIYGEHKYRSMAKPR